MLERFARQGPALAAQAERIFVNFVALAAGH
jgi:hypothetical protein